MAPPLLAELAPFLPRVLLRRLAARGGRELEPESHPLSGALLFADVSGFTAVAERLTARGEDGLEELTERLGGFFGPLQEIVTAHGGDVVKFAGDALLALWAADESGGDLSLATWRAARCTQEILRSHARPSSATPTLEVHAALGAGDLALVIAGGALGRWEMVLTGAPLGQVGRAVALAPPGSAMLSPRAVGLLEGRATGVPSAGGHVMLVDAADVEVRPVPSPVLPAGLERGLEAFVPGAVLRRVRAGHAGWLAELRRVSVLFVGMPDLAGDAVVPLSEIQRAVRALQESVYAFEGSINKVTVDDRGTTLVAAFGLPPLAHEDDAFRAVAAALRIRAVLAALGSHPSIGVATGLAFCGTVGGPTRWEYTMVGDVVNLAARLMQEAGDGVICDGETHRASQERVDDVELPAIAVKGKAAPVTSFRPLRTRAAVRPVVPALVGRSSERREIADALASLGRDGRATLLFVQGGAGTGKSRLLLELEGQARRRGATVLRAAGDPVDRATAYRAFRPVVHEVLRLPRGAAGPDIVAALSGHAGWAARASLLAGVLGIELPEEDATRLLAGPARAEATRRVLLEVLRSAEETAPLVILLDDAHDLDSPSWALFEDASRQLRRTLLAAAMKPLPEPRPAELGRLLRSPALRALELGPLPRHEAAELLAARLSIDAVPELLVAAVLERAEGNPYAIEELARALKDGGLVRVEGRRAAFAEPERLAAFRLPETVQGAVTRRIDALAPEEQLALKAASVLGRTFRPSDLAAVHPARDRGADLEGCLSRLRDADLVEATDEGFAFRQVIVQEVAYHLMLPGQRRALHLAAARHFAGPPPRRGFQAYHFVRAEAVEEAVDACEAAADAAIRDQAHREAIGLLQDALSMDARRASASPAPRRARWHRLIGESCLVLGELARAAGHVRHALDLLGCPAPRTAGQRVATLLSEMARQAWHRATGRGEASGPSEPSRDGALREAARGYTLLTHCHFFANEPVASVVCALRTLNLAERAGASTELAQSYATMGIIAGLVPLHRLSDFYGARGAAVALALGDRSTRAFALLRDGVHGIGAGAFARVAAGVREAEEIAAELGDEQRRAECLVMGALAAYPTGDLEGARRRWSELVNHARSRGNQLHLAWGLAGQGECLLPMGRPREALELLAGAIAIYAENADRISEITAFGLTALARLSLGDAAGADAAAAEARKRSAGGPPTSFSTREGLAGVAVVALCAAERSGSATDLAVARDACKRLWRYARVFPIGRPRALLLWGRYLAVEDRRARALRAVERARDAARDLGLPWDEGLACVELARLCDRSDPDRRRQVARARELFAAIGAAQGLVLCDDVDRS